ncbi:site-specific integrase [Hymenobacter sp. M29]|uniref:Site-specific integrase n=1 Tax=Hymenobacter mellowenesis TaxID=3063995 RepID=A0ABT9AHD8_9BACT|nr:site-specific integrase [Hymenobacter sp. M29]MDO7849249.1 site-specific integrase [Hymenobacter sp. M29]
MSGTAKIKVVPPARADGTTQVRMRVIVNREIVPISLKITWPALLVDEKEGVLLTKLPKAQQPEGYAEAVAVARRVYGPKWEQQAADYNLAIGQALAKANKVFVDARLGGYELDKTKFLRDYQSSGSKLDFLVFMETSITERWNRGEIKKNTWKNHRSTLNALKEFRKKIPFNSFNFDFPEEFDGWLRKQGVTDLNTRWARHKDVKTYLARAKRERIAFEPPYAYFKVPIGESSWKPMTPGELTDLEAYYKMCAPRTPHRRILQKFLFSCNSSLRLSDLVHIGQAKLTDRKLKFRPMKGQEKTGKELLLPLTRKALRYLQEAQTENGTEGFFNYADQYENRTLKAIAGVLGIETNLHHHVGRETFATEFIRHGGRVEVLQKLMGHTKLSMTMRYVHVDEDMKQAEIDRIDALDSAS